MTSSLRGTSFCQRSSRVRIWHRDQTKQELPRVNVMFGDEFKTPRKEQRHRKGPEGLLSDTCHRCVPYITVPANSVTLLIHADEQTLVSGTKIEFPSVCDDAGIAFVPVSVGAIPDSYVLLLDLHEECLFRITSRSYVRRYEPSPLSR